CSRLEFQPSGLRHPGRHKKNLHLRRPPADLVLFNLWKCSSEARPKNSMHLNVVWKSNRLSRPSMNLGEVSHPNKITSVLRDSSHITNLIANERSTSARKTC